MDSIDNGERCFVCSNSKRKIKLLTDYLIDRYGENKQILGITSDNSQDSKIEQFIRNIKEQILDYDVVLVSPSVDTGVDITFKNNAMKIDCVYGFFEARVNTHFDIDQQISRVRHPKAIRLWISPERFRFETDPGVIKREVQNTDSSFRRLLHIDDDGKKVYTHDNDGYLNLYANVKSMQRGSKNHLRKQFVKMKDYYGWTINTIEPIEEKTQEGIEVLKVAKELQEQARINDITAAKLITREEYVKLKILQDNLPLTEQHASAMRRYEIESFYYTVADAELIKNDQDGKLRQQVREYENFLKDDAQLMVKDRAEAEIHDSHVTDRKMLLAKKRFYQKTLRNAGLCDDDNPIICEKIIHNDDLKACIAFIKTHKTKIQRWFDIDLRKDIDKKPVQQLGVFLKLLGLSWQRSTKKRPDGGKDYFYWIPQEQVDALNEIVTHRANSKLTEKWHKKRESGKRNRLFTNEQDLVYQIKDQIRNNATADARSNVISFPLRETDQIDSELLSL